MRALFFIGILLAVLVPFISFAQYQELKFKHFSPEQGLSSSNVTAIAQTKDGYLWVGTTDGLNRFDGYNFKVYQNDPQDSSSLADNNITTLFVDSHDNLWIGTKNNGLSRYISARDNFKNYPYIAHDNHQISSYYITKLIEDSNRVLWVATIMGLNRYNAMDDTFDRFFTDIAVKIEAHTIDSLKSMHANAKIMKAANSLLNIELNSGQSFHTALREKLSSKEVHQFEKIILKHSSLRVNADHIKTLTADNVGNLWLAIDKKGIVCFNTQTLLTKNYTQKLKEAAAHKKSITSLCLQNKTLWFGTQDGALYMINTANQNISRYKLPATNYNIETIISDSKGSIWMGDDYGLYHLTNKKTFQYQNDENNECSLSETSVKIIFEDNQKNLWVGCSQGGLNLTLSDTPFEHYKHYADTPNSLSKNSISSVLEDSKGNVWIGYYTMGIDVWNRKSNTIRSYSYDANQTDGIGKGTVFEIFEDREGIIWIGTYEGGLQSFDLTTKKFRTYKYDPANSQSISGNDVRSIVEDHEGNLWLAIHGHGVNKFDRKTHAAERFNADYDHWMNTLANDWVFVLCADNNGNIWAGSVFGVSVLYKGAKNFISYSKSNSNLSHNQVRSLMQDHENKIWIGTENGLNLFDSEKRSFKLVSEKDGLPNSMINGILEDASGSLWISTNKGLSRYSPSKNTFINYKVLDGLQSDEFFPGAHHKGKSGLLYFAGSNGLNIIDPSKIKSDTISVPVRLAGLSLFNKPIGIDDNILKASLDKTEAITLRNDQNVFNISFVGLSFKNSEKIQYAYKLAGFENDWNYVGTKREATYTNLDPGDYYFEVKAANGDGVWSYKPKTLKISVLPPLWKTPWAYAVYVIVSLCILYLYRMSVLSRERLKSKLELQKLEAIKTHEVDEMKIRFFTNISHEFRTPLTLIVGPLDKLIYENKLLNSDARIEYYHLIKRNAQLLLRLINQLLDISAFDAGCMKLNVVRYDIVAFCRSIGQAFAHRADKLNITYNFNANIDTAEVYFDHDKVEKIIYNLISNALKFTPANGEVKLNIYITDDRESQIPARLFSGKNRSGQFIKIEVEDNGYGIPAALKEKIFERFYQVKSTSVKRVGTGIGLALTKQLVDLHLGDLQVESEDGKGSKFIVWLPVSQSWFALEDIMPGNPNIEYQAEDIQIESATFTLPEDSNQQTNDDHMMGMPVLLIVEDSDDVRRYIQLNLKDEFIIYEANNGREGFEKILNVCPDVVLSDVMMPEVDGFEFCKQIKNDPRTCHIPVMLLTARSSEHYELEGLHLGADDYVSKPFSLPVLKARLKNIVDSRVALKEKLYSDLNFEPKEIATNTLDKGFMDQVIACIEDNLGNEDFSPEILADAINLSRSQLYKKMKGLTGLSVSIFIRNIRLRKAAHMLMQGKRTISEVAYSVGFSDPGYFTKCFKEMYSKSPSEYLQQVHY
jgi:signal transduction histidine kinase/ligand-binding sensor domain-containing protein/DNA-binding response OmpR family regulator